MPGHTANRTLTGRTLSPGLGEGEVFVYRDVLARFDEFYDIDDGQVEEELRRLDRALARISGDLRALADRVKKEIDSQLSGVFHAHLAMIQDPSLRTELEKEIRDELVSTGRAVKIVFRRWERRFRTMEAEVARQKGDDMRDLARRLVSALAGVHSHALEEMPQGCVLVANRLLPSDTIFLDRKAAAAALLEVGGRASHAAIFAREIGLPCVAGFPDLLETVPEGCFALVDAGEAQAILDPTAEQREAFKAERERRTRAGRRARAHAHEPAVTPDGIRIAVLANVGDAEDTEVAVDNGADGVGLYRLEQTYMGRQHPPSTDELVEEMRTTLQPAKGLPVCVRLLDVGADKPLPFLDMPRESNPSLGQCGIRFLQQYPDLLRTQIEALLQLSGDHDLQILVPMVTLPVDMNVVRESLTVAASTAKVARIPALGAMVETPAAALAAPGVLGRAQFLSFGTNDLTQYSFAADRENPAVDTYFDDSHEVIFRLITMVRDELPGVPLSVCGALAARPEATSRLIDCGITSLSVPPPAIPALKEAVRICHLPPTFAASAARREGCHAGAKRTQ